MMNKVVNTESLAWKIEQQNVNLEPIIKNWSAFTETIISCKKNKISIKNDLLTLDFLEATRRALKLSEDEMYFKPIQEDKAQISLDIFIEILKNFDNDIMSKKDVDRIIGIFDCLSAVCSFNTNELIEYLQAPNYISRLELGTVSKEEVVKLFLKIPECIFNDSYLGNYALLLSNSFFVNFAKRYLNIKDSDIFEIVNILELKRKSIGFEPKESNTPLFVLNRRSIDKIITEFLKIKKVEISKRNKEAVLKILFKKDAHHAI